MNWVTDESAAVALLTASPFMTPSIDGPISHTYSPCRWTLLHRYLQIEVQRSRSRQWRDTPFSPLFCWLGIRIQSANLHSVSLQTENHSGTASPLWVLCTEGEEDMEVVVIAALTPNRSTIQSSDTAFVQYMLVVTALLCTTINQRSRPVHRSTPCRSFSGTWSLTHFHVIQGRIIFDTCEWNWMKEIFIGME